MNNRNSSFPLLSVTLSLMMLALLPGCSLLQNSESKHLMKAEEYSRQEQYDKAIDEYRQHMRYRLGLSKRPEWENPHFYLILIGDLQLIQDRPTEALATLQEAEKQGVDVNLISDRYRSLAHFYEKKGDFSHAFAILKERRDQDPILFDAMLDRIAKKIVATQDSVASSRQPSDALGNTHRKNR